MVISIRIYWNSFFGISRRRGFCKGKSSLIPLDSFIYVIYFGFKNTLSFKFYSRSIFCLQCCAFSYILFLFKLMKHNDLIKKKRNEKKSNYRLKSYLMVANDSHTI